MSGRYLRLAPSISLLFEVSVFECSPLFRCYIIHLYFMRRRHRWALSTTEFIMFAFLLLHSELMFVGEIRIFDENFCSPVVFFFSFCSPIFLSQSRAHVASHLFTVLQFACSSSIIIIYLLSYRTSSVELLVTGEHKRFAHALKFSL